MSDPYEGFRDDSGRFTKGNPGGSGRPHGSYSWLSDVELVEMFPWLVVPVPCPCPECGGVGSRFKMRMDGGRSFTLVCRCNHCNHRRWFKPYSNSWE